MLTVDDSLLIAMANTISSTYDFIMFALIVVTINSIVQIVTSIIRVTRRPASAADVAKEILNAPLPPIKTGQVSVEEDIYKQYMGSPDIEKAIPTIVEDRR